MPDTSTPVPPGRTEAEAEWVAETIVSGTSSITDRGGRQVHRVVDRAGRAVAICDSREIAERIAERIATLASPSPEAPDGLAGVEGLCDEADAYVAELRTLTLHPEAAAILGAFEALVRRVRDLLARRAPKEANDV